MSSFLSCFRRSPAVRVCGLLGSADIASNGEELWQATDFVALRELIGAHGDKSIWLCSAPIHTCGNIILGDPACDRLQFNPPTFETVVPVEELLVVYLLEVNRAALKLKHSEILVLVLVGHGDPATGSFIVGDNEMQGILTKKLLEHAVTRTKGTIFLLSTACYSGSWESPCWTLLAAAASHEEAPSIAASGSGKCRFFTSALIAEHAHEFGINTPHPASVDETGYSGSQYAHDFGHEKPTNPSRRLPKPSLQGVCDWIHQLRDDIGRVYTTANITFLPCSSSEPHLLPFLPLNSPKATLHHLSCIPPSLPTEPALSSTGKTQSILPPSRLPTQELMELSVSDEAELVEMATEVLRFMPPSVPSEHRVILRSWKVIHAIQRGEEPLDKTKKSRLLSVLRNRECCRKCALSIARNLGWEKEIAQLGGPCGKQSQLVARHTLLEEAEASGCLVRSLIVREGPIRVWTSVAGWLARVWEAAGRPIITAKDWEEAVEKFHSIQFLHSIIAD
jgi:hypothetical protein